MKALATVIVAWAIAGAAQAQAQDWVIGGAGGTVAQAYDQGRIYSQGNIRSTWVLTVFRETQRDGNFDYVIARMSFDCDSNRFSSESNMTYRIGVDEPISEPDYSGRWFEVPQGTVMSSMTDSICADVRQESLGADQPHVLAESMREYMAGQ